MSGIARRLPEPEPAELGSSSFCGTPDFIPSWVDELADARHTQHTTHNIQPTTQRQTRSIRITRCCHPVPSHPVSSSFAYSIRPGDGSQTRLPLSDASQTPPSSSSVWALSQITFPELVNQISRRSNRDPVTASPSLFPPVLLS